TAAMTAITKKNSAQLNISVPFGVSFVFTTCTPFYAFNRDSTSPFRRDLEWVMWWKQGWDNRCYREKKHRARRCLWSISKSYHPAVFALHVRIPRERSNFAGKARLACEDA